MSAKVVEPSPGLLDMAAGQPDRRINRDSQVPPKARLLREAAGHVRIVLEPHERRLPNRPGRP